MTKRRFAAAALAALLLGACGYSDWHGEAFSAYYPRPSRETGQTLEERLQLMQWTKDPRKKTRIGYLEKYSILLEGSRTPHDIYYIRNAAGTATLGYINENGVFFRYTGDGRAERVGEFPIRDTGIRIFFGLSKEDNLGFEEINPYSD
ncbi:MAG TPA: hypothetical protein VGK61_08195 [Planctomycetota bacterium]